MDRYCRNCGEPWDIHEILQANIAYLHSTYPCNDEFLLFSPDGRDEFREGWFSILICPCCEDRTPLIIHAEMMAILSYAKQIAGDLVDFEEAKADLCRWISQVLEEGAKAKDGTFAPLSKAAERVLVALRERFEALKQPDDGLVSKLKALEDAAPWLSEFLKQKDPLPSVMF